MRNLLGMVTYGNTFFTKLALENTIKNTSSKLDYFIIVGKPGDFETKNLLEELKFPYTEHHINKGFPASINDIYDYFLVNKYDNLILQGNDVLPYPYSIDLLLKIRSLYDYDWISGKEYSVKNLVKDFPETAELFTGNDLKFVNLDRTPWENFKHYNNVIEIDLAGLADCQNLNLYTRNAIETLGYTDVNFYPGGYFNDNDYVKRAIELRVKSCQSNNSYYFHFWSRTIHQGDRTTTSKIFEKNKEYYIIKWGGVPGQERYSLPFNGYEHLLGYSTLNISSRDTEDTLINYWKQYGN